MPRWQYLEVQSDNLAGNLLGDPSRRNTAIYLPPDYEAGKSTPVVMLLHGYGHRSTTWSMPAHLRAGMLRNGLGEKLDELAASGKQLPVVIVPDGWTSYGGGQWLDSPVGGRLHTYLVDDVVPAVAEHLSLGGLDGRLGVVGYSSGGLGAWEIAIKRPGLASAIALLASPSYFEMTSLQIIRKYLFSVGRKGPQGPVDGDETSWLAYGISSAYSPNPDAAPYYVDFPYDWETGDLLDDVWRKWQERDPVFNAERHAESLWRLNLIFLAAGSKDSFGSQYGHRQLARRLSGCGVHHEVEEFEGGHSDGAAERVAAAILKVAGLE